MAKRSVSLFMVALLLIPSAAGAAQPTYGSYPDRLKDVEAAAPGNSLVIGSIELFKDGKKKTCGEFIVSDCRLILLPPVGSHAIIYTFRGTGEFSWSLPPGEYTVLGFEYVERGIDQIFMRAHFTVPPGGKTIYIGHLALLSKGNVTVPGLARAYDTAVAQYRAKHPQLPAPEDAVMQADEDPGAAGEVQYICAEGWGISCTKQFRGITPVRPTEVKSFGTIDRVDPTFQWQPSADPQVTYDIILYEAADYKGRNGTNYTLGRLAAYRQGLTTPSWQIDHPLRPGQRYFWSVRLRKGDIVSNWSTYTYFNFFLIGFSSGSGQWFSFTVPTAASEEARQGMAALLGGPQGPSVPGAGPTTFTDALLARDAWNTFGRIQLAAFGDEYPPASSCPACLKSVPDWWRLSEASAGVSLSAHETSRSQVNGRTQVGVSFEAKGFPQDKNYEFWSSSADGLTVKIWDLSSDPNGNLRLLGKDGTFSRRFNDLNMILAGFVKGERMEYALVSADRTIRAFAKFIPFPLEARQGRCRIWLELLNPTTFVGQGDGFEPGEELDVISRSDGEVLEGKLKASPEGKVGPGAILPAAIRRLYRANWTVTGRSCSVSLDYAWGPPAAVKQ